MKPLFVLICSLALATVAWAHSPAEDAEIGIKILFEAGPLPAMTQQKSSLTFLVRDMNAEDGAEPVAGLIENAEVTVKMGDQSWGPFPVAEGRRNPGNITLEKVFAYPGEYEVFLDFNKTGDPTPRQFHWDTTIADWNDIVLD